MIKSNVIISMTLLFLMEKVYEKSRTKTFKKGEQLLAGVQGANSQAAIQETVLKNNIANFWTNLKWENQKNKKTSSSVPQGLTPMQAAFAKAGYTDQSGQEQYTQKEQKNSLSPEGISIAPPVEGYNVRGEDVVLAPNVLSDKPAQIQSLSKKYGTQAPAMVAAYSSGQNVSEYDSAFSAAYNMGREGVRLDYAMKSPATSYLSEAQREIAWLAGADSQSVGNLGRVNKESVLQKQNQNDKIDTRENKEEGNERKEVYLRNGGERNRSENTGRNISAMESGAGQDSSRSQQRKGAKDRETASLTYGEKVSTAELGIENGSNDDGVFLVESGETSAMKKARNRARKRGLEVVFFAGDNIHIGEDSARGYIKGDRVFIRVDHPLYDADQLMRHEEGHDRIARGEVDPDKVRDRIKNLYGKENFDFISEMYAEAYEGSNLDADEIWEEIVCDSLGDMNIFARLGELGVINKSFLKMVKKDVKINQDSMRTSSNNEGKASKEAKYIPYGKIGKENIDYIRQNLRTLYRGVENAIADGIAIEKGKVVYIVDSGKESGEISFGIRRKITISNEERRTEFVRRTNYDSKTRGHISDGPSARLGIEYDNNRGSDRRSELGQNAQVDKREPQHNQIGVFEDNGDRGRVTPNMTEKKHGALSRELDAESFDGEVSPRELFINALEGTVHNKAEIEILEQYRAKMSKMNAEQAKLQGLKAKIKKLSFAKGPRDSAKIAELRAEVQKAENRINIYDKQLLRIESAKIFAELIEREKARAYKRAREKGREVLREYREKGKKREIIRKIKGLKAEIEQALLHPTDRKYIPAALGEAMIDICNLINIDTPIYKSDGSINKAQAERDETKLKLEAIRDLYKALKNSDSFYAGDYDDVVEVYFEELVINYKDKPLSAMSLEALQGRLACFLLTLISCYAILEIAIMHRRCIYGSSSAY